ncbi:MAG: helix-turn-helix domain-containing protein [Chitinispirillaceae bacterium]|nr:helix-turn-helix domain-containing protein [Chitinispirillaceae bacterium]
MTKSIKNRMLTTSAVARLLNIHVNTVRRWSNSGVLTPYRIGPRGDRRFPKDEVLRFLSNYDEYVIMDNKEKKEYALKG